MTTLAEHLPPLDVPRAPRRAEPLPADRPVRWGILSTGNIATAFVKDLALVDACEVTAVGARRQESAETEHLVALARERDLFLMEAMWMRCNRLIRRLEQVLATGALGRVRQVRRRSPPTGAASTWRHRSTTRRRRPGRRTTVTAPTNRSPRRSGRSGSAWATRTRRSRWSFACETGRPRVPLMPLDETVSMMRLMDLIRKRIGVRYAADGLDAGHASKSSG